MAEEDESLENCKPASTQTSLQADEDEKPPLHQERIIFCERRYVPWSSYGSVNICKHYLYKQALVIPRDSTNVGKQREKNSQQKQTHGWSRHLACTGNNFETISVFQKIKEKLEKIAKRWLNFAR